MLAELNARICSDEFTQLARHPDHPQAFTRNRRLPLPALIGALLTMRNQSQQLTVDTFFGAVQGGAVPLRGVSDRAFAKARSHLHLPALESLNDLVVRRADEAGLIERWHGLRVVAADASVLMPAVRPCLQSRSAADPDQRLFALYLPGAELTLHASVHSATVAERRMLMQALDLLGPQDVLVLDRGYPAAWLVAVLNARGIRYVMRCDNEGGWSGVKNFASSGLDQTQIELTAPSADDDSQWGCGRHKPSVRLVRQRAPNGQFRVLATNLDAQVYPPAMFGDLYHQRWRIEEAFKRIKHRLKLEAVSGLSQHALIIDVAAKVLADNLSSLMCAAATEQATSPPSSTPRQHARKINRSYAAAYLRNVLPRLMLRVGDICSLIAQAIKMLATNTLTFIPNRSQPRPNNHVKPHPSLAYKG